jgi:hypothetical protein
MVSAAFAVYDFPIPEESRLEESRLNVLST